MVKESTQSDRFTQKARAMEWRILGHPRSRHQQPRVRLPAATASLAGGAEKALPMTMREATGESHL